MAHQFLSLTISASAPPPALVPATSPTSTSFPASSWSAPSLLPPMVCLVRRSDGRLTRGRRRSWVVGMAPEDEKMTRRSPLDFPIEWERPKPGRRPDILPQFSPMKTPLPPPLPADPPPEEDEEEEEEEKKEEEEEDPDKEDPDKKD